VHPVAGSASIRLTGLGRLGFLQSAPTPFIFLWAVLSVTGCEASNVLLVLREAILASRNLPILFYRVHCNDRDYGTGWKKILVAPEGLTE
jgi:hypothetical protein